MITEIKHIKSSLDDNLFTGANWDNQDDGYTATFLEQNQRQFWLPEEIALTGDLNVWNTLTDEVKRAYAENLAVLTFLDTHQGDMGMNIIGRSLDANQHQKKALLSFMGAVENSIHAKSYSNIFMTYMPKNDIEDLFRWCEQSKAMQSILAQIVGYYRNLEKLIYEKEYTTKKVDEEKYKIAQWKAMCSSTFLESALFYTGFYYPLWFGGQGKLTMAAEIISLIIRDEAVHGLYVGMLANEIFISLPENKQKELKEWLYALIEELYAYEIELIHEIYDKVELSHDVKVFLRYNFNKALMNLGQDVYFENEEVNPVVLRGIDVGSKQHDFFSQKGDTYTVKEVEKLLPEDFIFDDVSVSAFIKGKR